jgi:hypothetical protein
MPRQKRMDWLNILLAVLVLLFFSLACEWSGNPNQSSAPPGQAQDIAYLRAMALNFYRAASRQDIAAIVRLMDPNDVGFHQNCEDLAQGFEGTQFELLDVDPTKIQVTIFPQTNADQASGIRRAWTRDFTARIKVNGGVATTIQLGQDKFINRGTGWKLAGFYINKDGIGLPYPFACGRFSNANWH